MTISFQNVLECLTINCLFFFSLSQDKKENHQHIQPTNMWAGTASKVCSLNPSSRATFCMCRKATPSNHCQRLINHRPSKVLQRWKIMHSWRICLRPTVNYNRTRGPGARLTCHCSLLTAQDKRSSTGTEAPLTPQGGWKTTEKYRPSGTAGPNASAHSRCTWTWKYLHTELLYLGAAPRRRSCLAGSSQQELATWRETGRGGQNQTANGKRWSPISLFLPSPQTVATAKTQVCAVSPATRAPITADSPQSLRKTGRPRTWLGFLPIFKTFFGSFPHYRHLLTGDPSTAWKRKCNFHKYWQHLSPWKTNLL